jgi:predicted nucleotidyltransferase
MNRTIEELAANFARLEDVEALVLAGSAATGLTDEWSDYDLYAYSRGVVPIEFRAKFLKPRATRLELHNTFWEWSDEWVESDGTIFDLMYRSCDANRGGRGSQAWARNSRTWLLRQSLPLGVASDASV